MGEKVKTKLKEASFYQLRPWLRRRAFIPRLSRIIRPESACDCDSTRRESAPDFEVSYL